jgi:hypothetical protein
VSAECGAARNDITIDFRDLPGLGRTISRADALQPIA